MTVSQIDLKKNLMLFAHNKVWLRSLPPKIDTTPSGPVVPLFLPSLPSRVNGSPRRSMRRMVPRSSTESACEINANL